MMRSSMKRVVAYRSLSREDAYYSNCASSAYKTIHYLRLRPALFKSYYPIHQMLIHNVSDFNLAKLEVCLLSRPIWNQLTGCP
jgi:hypothetical protein